MNSSEKSKRRDPDNIAFARDQRARANEFVQDVWQMVRSRRCRNQKFRREYPIPPYTADFCCVALKLIVEVDGEHHQTVEGKTYDAARDKFLAEQGYEVLRISGYQVKRDPAVVLNQIESAIDDRLDAARLPHPQPLSLNKLKERGVREVGRLQSAFWNFSQREGGIDSCLCGFVGYRLPLLWLPSLPNLFGERGRG